MANFAASRVGRWLSHAVPTREGVAANRWLRPVAHRVLAPSLWRFTRRSVPRGVALGIFSGILFPFAHMVLAAILALPCRANVPTAVGATLVNNPLTFVPLMAASYRVGRWILRLDSHLPGRPVASVATSHVGALHWLVSEAGPATIVGMLVIAVVLSALGYAITALAWRVRIGVKWRNRPAARQA